MAIKVYIGTETDIATALAGGTPSRAVDYTPWFVTVNGNKNTLTFTSDLRTGGETGDTASEDIVLSNYDQLMPSIQAGYKISIFDSNAIAECLFGGILQGYTINAIAKNNEGEHVNQYKIRCLGYKAEADRLAIDEQPFYNINAGKLIKYLLEKYTTLQVGQIDEVDSPTISFVRLSYGRKFSEVLSQVANLWSDCEAFIANDHTNGYVFFRKTTTSQAPIILNEATIEQLTPDNVKIQVDTEKSFNIVSLSFFEKKTNPPEYFKQDTVADVAFLKTTAILNHLPANPEESTLLYTDFNGQAPIDSYIFNPVGVSNPVTDFIKQEAVNNVAGLNFIPVTTAGQSVATFTNASANGWTGEANQVLLLEEVAINTLGVFTLPALVDNTTVIAKVVLATTTTLTLDDATAFKVGDIVDVLGISRYIQSKASNTLTLAVALPFIHSMNTAVTLSILSKSRIKLGLAFYESGQMGCYSNGVLTVLSGITYTPATYSVRVRNTSTNTIIEIKGGAFSSITSREWVTLITKPIVNTGELAIGIYNTNGAFTVPSIFLKNKPNISVSIQTTGQVLNVGVGELESSDKSIDCILRLVGGRYQLDFFADTKYFWGSASTLKVEYDLKIPNRFIKKDNDSMRLLANLKGYTDLDTPLKLKTYGGKVLAGIDLGETPFTLKEVDIIAGNILSAVKDFQYQVNFITSTFFYPIIKAGQSLILSYKGMEKTVRVEQVQYTHNPSIATMDNASIIEMDVKAGSYDRLNEALANAKNAIKQKLVIDDGVNNYFEKTIDSNDFSESLDLAFQETLLKVTKTNYLFSNGVANTITNIEVGTSQQVKIITESIALTDAFTTLKSVMGSLFTNGVANRISRIKVR